ncbi:MAG: alpha/beta hydrolase [Bryobacterales bacterium]|nr:alpha/beta hydrolase [Bryobacterales bacterium]
MRGFFVFLLTVAGPLTATENILLWPSGAPGSEGKPAAPLAVRTTPGGDQVISGVHSPSITVYLPAKEEASGAAVLIAPGGGHRELWTTHEGHNEAQWLAARGVAAFVLYYRLAREKDSTYTVEGHALSDTQRAIRLVRSRASEWRINPDRVGIMGFSAGGELAALVSYRNDSGIPGAPDPVDRQPSRPDFFALIYPAIPRDMVPFKDMAPSFLACGENDRVNISQGLAQLYLKIKKAGASSELHIYAGVGHGFGLRPTLKGPVSTWMDRFHDWLGGKALLGK